MSSVPLNDACQRYRPNTTPEIRIADVPCRTYLVLWHPRGFRRHLGPLPPHSHQRARLPGPKTSSTNKSCRRIGLSPEEPHRPPLVSWHIASTQLPTRFCSPPRGARPQCLPVVHRSREATCRLSASAVDCQPSTPSTRPNFSFRWRTTLCRIAKPLFEIY